MPRLPDIADGPMTPRQREIYEAIQSGPRGRVEGPLRVWLHSPELADRSQALGAFCRYGSSLSARHREFVILVVAAEWRAGFEWTAHAPLAREAGVGEPVIEDLLKGGDLAGLDPDLAVLRDFALALMQRHHVEQALFDAALRLLGQAGLVELVGLIGYYGYISMTIKAFAVDAPGGDPFARAPS